MPKLNQSIFREYDIRGHESEEELNFETIELIARGYAAFLHKRGIDKVVVGHDNRQSSEEFYKAAVKGLVESGVKVFGIGLSLTPQMYWAQYFFESQGGLMITASHNPAGWNGVKLALGYSYTLMREELLEVDTIIEKEEFVEGEGTLVEQNIFEDWAKDLLSRVRLHKPMKILLNTANATASFFSPKLLREFGCEVVEHNTNPDPHYPNYVPNPANIEMITDTGKQTVASLSSVGIAVDADGDRLGVCDEKGNIVWPDRWIILLARQVLEKQPDSKIVFDEKVSESLSEDILQHGGVPVMWKTGHAYMKEKMLEVSAAFAAEASGHVYYKQGYYGFDDANFAALKLLEYLSNQEKTLSEIIATTPHYIITPSLHAQTSDDVVKYKIVEEVVKEFKEEGFRVLEISGGRVYMESGWGLIRATSNMPGIEVRFEAKTEEDLQKIRNVFMQKLSKYKEVSSVWESA